MSVRGDFSSIKRMKQSLRTLPTTFAHAVAKRASPAMTQLTQSAFTSGQSVYGDARPAGVDGKPLSLVASGTTQRTLRFTSQGTVIRAVLGTRYAKYLIGKYGILPNGALPASWSRRLGELVRETGAEVLR